MYLFSFIVFFVLFLSLILLLIFTSSQASWLSPTGQQTLLQKKYSPVFSLEIKLTIKLLIKDFDIFCLIWCSNMFYKYSFAFDFMGF